MRGALVPSGAATGCRRAGGERRLRAAKGASELAIPSYKDIDLALLLELVRAGRAVRPSETYHAVARHFPELSEADLAQTRKDGRTKAFQNAVHWARDHLRVRSLLVDERAGLWQVNDGASSALKEDLLVRGVAREMVQGFLASTKTLDELLGPEWAKPVRSRKETARAPDRPTAPVTAPAEQPPTSRESVPDRVEPAPGDLRQAITARLHAMDGYEFEQFVARVLDGAGLRNSQVVGRSGDEGVDILAELYSPLVVASVAVQVKRHSSNVGPKDISYLRDRWARRADKLLFVTTSDYTPGAREVADESDKKVVLVNGSQLVDLMFEHSLGVKQLPMISFELDEDFFTG